MSESIVVVTKIAAVFLVMLVGFVARRRDAVGAATVTSLGVLAADLCLPALTFTQLLATVDATRIRSGLAVVALGAAVILLGHALGWATRGLFASPAERPTFVFCAAMANWIYLPLPIVEALHGARGVEALLLINVGAQLVLWTVGIATLRAGRPSAGAAAALARNPGLIAAVGGIACALLLPRAVPAPWSHAAHALDDGLRMIGSLTVPLSVLVTGAQLGGLTLRRPGRAALGVVAIRLVAAPAAAIALVWAAGRAGLALPEPGTMIAALVAGMPVAVSAGILTAKHDQDTALASESILWSTLGSVATVPVLVWAFHRLA
jgi:predicted permease